LLILFLTLLFGAAAAVIRGFQLTSSFDPQTALIEPGDLPTVFLIAMSAAFVILTAVYLWLKKSNNPGKRLDNERPLGGVWFFVQLTALASLFSASCVDVINGFSDARWSEFFTRDSNIRWSVVCLGFLGLLSTGALLMVSLNMNKRPSGSAPGFWATVPIFWSCLMLVTDFWGQAGSPVRSAYVYGMLASVFCTIALYTVAGFFFGRAKPAGAMFYALPGIYFSVLTLGGYLFSLWLGDPIYTLSLSAMFRHGFIILHLSASAVALLRGKLTPPPVPEPEEA
jgi:hypothetical protein